MKNVRIIREEGGLIIFEEQGVRAFLIIGEETALLVDTGMHMPDIRSAAEALTGGRPLRLLNTHTDPDHTSGNGAFQEVMMTEAEWKHFQARGGSGFAPVIVTDGEIIDLGGRVLEVVSLPGHTPGHITLLDPAYRRLIGGDSIQDGRIFMFGPGRDMEAYVRSLEKLWAERSGDFDTICPSHGTCPVGKDIIPRLIEGARAVFEGRVTGTPVQVMGRPVTACDVGCAVLLCPAAEA